MDEFEGLPEEISSQLAALGSDLSRPHSFNCYLYPPSESVARNSMGGGPMLSKPTRRPPR